MIKIHEGISRPEPGSQFLAGDDLSRFLEKQAEDLEGLLLETNFGPASRELPASQISFEQAEADG
jgi:hypothetical protein